MRAGNIHESAEIRENFLHANISCYTVILSYILYYSSQECDILTVHSSVFQSTLYIKMYMYPKFIIYLT